MPNNNNYVSVDPCVGIWCRIPPGVWNNTGEDVESLSDISQPHTEQNSMIAI